MATSPQPLPTAASLAADCAALIAELRSAQARLRAMDAENGVFHNPTQAAAGRPAAGSPAGGSPGAGQPAAGQPAAGAGAQGQGDGAASADFVKELANRFESIGDRLKQTARRVRVMKDGGVVVSGFPSGRTKLPNDP